MILGYFITSYVLVFFAMKWYARNVTDSPIEFRLLMGLLWLMSPMIPPALILGALGWAIGAIITRGCK